MTSPAEALILRLETVRRRLADHAAAGAHAGLTGADPRTGERWDAGQVWAHLAEFPGYWLVQFRRLLRARAEETPEPIAFGRTTSDPGRRTAIERERHTDPALLDDRVDGAIEEAEAFLRGLAAADWATVGLHPALGPMDLPAMIERFLVGHLEEHADQLDALLPRADERIEA